MPLVRIVWVALLAASIACCPALAQRPAVRLILPASASLGNPPPKKLADPDALSHPNPIEIVPLPSQLPALTPPTPTPTPNPIAPINVSRLHDQLRAAFPASSVRLGYVGDRLVLTGSAAGSRDARAIEDLVHAAAGGRLVSHLRVRGQVLLHILAVEVDRRTATNAGLQTTNGVADAYRTAALLGALCSRRQATLLAEQVIPVVEGKTAAFSAKRCQITLCAASSIDTLQLTVSARFSPSDRCVLAQALQTVVELRPQDALVLEGHSEENEREIVLVVTPEWVGGGK